MRNPQAVRSRLCSLRAVVIAAALVGGFLPGSQTSRAVDLGLVKRAAAKKDPTANSNTIAGWHQLLNDARDVPELDKLKLVNDFVNRNIRFEDDQAMWGQPDYWATPIETLSAGAGDCEDFSIAKYYSLRAIGIPTARLRLIYVRAQLGGPNGGMTQAHMVVAYYPAPDSEPLVLDNLISEIRLASKRADLSPVFSFNSDGIWPGVGDKQATDTSRLSRWRDLLARARKEGFD